MAKITGRERFRIHAKQNGYIITLRKRVICSPICILSCILPNLRSEAGGVGDGLVCLGMCASVDAMWVPG